MNISGFVYYDPTRNAVPGTGLKNIPVALYNTGTGTGVVALTDATGAYQFTNVPAGTYKLVETWGTPGVATPVSFAAAVPMALPAEAEPPLSVVTVTPPPLATALDAITPN
ncbi:MAG: carboxypeptidase regulatory-like domain-containing protein, partial [Oscillibacter sp.]